MADEPLLLEEHIRRRLEPLMLVGSKVRAGAMKGERRSVKRGTSIEFADYRDYTPGDDLRRLDWNIFARLERPFVKLLEDEEDLAVHLLLDASESMDWPRKDGDVLVDVPADYNKLLFGKRLLSGLAYTSLTSNDRLLVAAMHGTEFDYFGPSRGNAFAVPMLRYTHDIVGRGTTDLNAALKAYAVRAGRPGLCVVISDLFSPDGYLDGLHTLLGRGYEVVIIHVLSPDEVSPPLGGDLRLVDVETGQAQEISIEAGMRELYMQRLEAWRESIHMECARRNVYYLPVTTDTPWERVILYDMRRLGLLK